jgi:putative transcriptional regulator
MKKLFIELTSSPTGCEHSSRTRRYGQMKKKKNEFYERLKQGLEEAILHARGEITLRTIENEMPDPPPIVKAKDVLKLRQRCKMSQSVFARVLNVSLKTVQSWEQGERKPSHASLRLLQILAAKPEDVCRIAGIRVAVA